MSSYYTHIRWQLTSVHDLIEQFYLPSLFWRHRSAFFEYIVLNRSLALSWKNQEWIICLIGASY